MLAAFSASALILLITSGVPQIVDASAAKAEVAKRPARSPQLAEAEQDADNQQENKGTSSVQKDSVHAGAASSDANVKSSTSNNSSPDRAPRDADSAASVDAVSSAATAPAGEKNPADTDSDIEDRDNRLLLLNLEAVAVPPETARVIGSLVAQTIARSTTVALLTAQDLSAMADLEAHRQTSGCDSTSCLAEIAGAMGTRYVVFGSVGRVGGLTVLELNLFDSHSAKPIAREQVRHTDEGQLVQRVDQTAARLVLSLLDESDPLQQVATQQVNATSPSNETGDVSSADPSSTGALTIGLLSAGAVAAVAGVAVGILGVAYFGSSVWALNTADAPALLRNISKYGLWGLTGPVLAVVLVAVGATAATAGFLME